MASLPWRGLNFLLHHHLAARDLGKPASAAGAMLPDVWRMADRRARTRDVDPAALVEAPADVRAVAQGIAHHVAADAWFHAAPAFTEGERAVREVLRTARDAAKLGLFAHITWELCLDGALLRHVGTDSVLGAVRGAIASVRPDAHHRAARMHVPAIEDAGVFDARVDQVLDAIARGPWVAGYATGPGVVERLEGVRARLGFPALTTADRDGVAEGLEELAGRADGAVEQILRARR